DRRNSNAQFDLEGAVPEAARIAVVAHVRVAFAGDVGLNLQTVPHNVFGDAQLEALNFVFVQVGVERVVIQFFKRRDHGVAACDLEVVRKQIAELRKVAASDV